MRLPVISSMEDMTRLVDELGFLPFFKGDVPGFSIAEAVRPDLWFSETQEGPWEWKGPVIRATGCAYGKFYRGKAMYVSREFFPDFANLRRDGYDYDARVDDGLARHRLAAKRAEGRLRSSGTEPVWRRLHFPYIPIRCVTDIRLQAGMTVRLTRRG